MLIATSLMYSEDTFEIEKQKKAMETWRALGFDIISCNVCEEMVQLKKLFKNVSFVELARSGKEIAGKPFPFIYDILQALKSKVREKNELCGIINSDIFLKNISINELELFFEYDKDKMLIMHRYDIEDELDTKGEYYFSGIDAFFFGSEYISVFPDMGFMLGRPEWDHWFLYEAQKAGMNICEVKNKVAFHIKHKQRWTAKDSNRMITSKVQDRKIMILDETYYCDTNVIMSDLKHRKMFGSSENKVAVVEREDGFWDDIDRKELLTWEKKYYGYDIESIGLMYFKDNKAYRICALHREINLCANESFALGEIKEKSKGNILRYVDFRDLDIFNDLKNVYVYPSGRAARLLVDCLETYGISVLGMVDKDNSLWGKTYLGKTINSISVLKKEEKYDHVLVASNLYISEIYSELTRIVDKEKLIVL